MKNSDRFLNAFIAIEMKLKEILKINHLPFSQLVTKAAKINEVVAYYEFDLIEYSQLRNAITHNRIGTMDEVIAEPHTKVVDAIEGIEKALTSAKFIVDKFKKKVVFADKSDSLEKVLALKKKTGYSVLPIYDGKSYLGTLSEPMLARWVEDTFPNVDPETKVVDLLTYSKREERVIFVDDKTTIFQAISIFTKRYQAGQRVAALIVSEKGRTNVLPIAVLTLADLPALLHELD